MIADPRLKLGVTLALILCISLLPVGAFSAYVAFYALAMVGTLLARLDPIAVTRRAVLVLPFAGAAAPLAVTTPGAPVGTLLGWTVTAEGIVLAMSIVFKAAVATQFAALLLMTTPFTDVLAGLVGLKVPAPLVSIAAFAYRYLHIFREEAQRLDRARQARSAVLPGGRPPGIVFQIRVRGWLIGSLLARGLARSERVAQAMAARGYRGQIVVEGPSSALPRTDLLRAGAAAVLGVVILLQAMVWG